jgi:hypothetical protein
MIVYLARIVDSIVSFRVPEIFLDLTPHDRRECNEGGDDPTYQSSRYESPPAAPHHSAGEVPSVPHSKDLQA